MGAGDVIAQQLVERRGLRGHHGTRTVKMMAVGFCFVVSASLRWAPGLCRTCGVGWGGGLGWDGRLG